MFKGAKKEDLRRIASELELYVSDKLTVLDFMDLIKNCDRYKNDPDSVHELANLIIEERKYEESQQLERKSCKYLEDEDLKNYDKIKSIILQEFEPTPQSCLEIFKKATRQNCESHVQFASRLTTNWEYYLKLRDVSNFEVLKQLTVSDKIFSTLDKETASHISVRQADKWFDPLTLGKEIDLFYSLRDPNLKLASERVIQPSSLGMQKEREREESSMGQLSAKASVFKPINYIGEISSDGLLRV
ncbi:DUF1758 domain-containing protein [Trichonephila clavipes]|nr:DUF1758 domain-containing protein [Trichonephila clavipes]